MSGMDTMMKTLLNAMGFNPQQFIEQTQAFVGGVNQTMHEVKSSFAEIKIALARIEQTQFVNHTEIVVKLEEIKPSVPPCVLEPDTGLNPLPFADDVYIPQLIADNINGEINAIVSQHAANVPNNATNSEAHTTDASDGAT